MLNIQHVAYVLELAGYDLCVLDPATQCSIPAPHYHNRKQAADYKDPDDLDHVFLHEVVKGLNDHQQASYLRHLINLVGPKNRNIHAYFRKEHIATHTAEPKDILEALYMMIIGI